MRRPSFCCDHHGGDHTKCHTQEGGHESTLARVRRFLALSVGGRSTSHNHRCKHHHQQQNQHHHHHHHAQPPDPLHAPAHAVHSLLADMKCAGVGVQGVLGRPLDEVMAAHGEDASGHGVPTLVHHLCSFLLTHGVDYDSLVSEDWCAEEVRTRLLLERGAAGVEPDTQQVPPGSDSAVATGLLRLFLDELPHALIPTDVAPLILQLAADSGVREDCGGSGSGGGGGGGSGSGSSGGEGGGGGLCVAVVPRLRRLLHRRLPLHHLCLLRYLAAFIHQLRTGNHNTCPVPLDSLSRVLARVLIGPDQFAIRGQSANRLGELLILCYSDIFQSTEEIVEDPADYSDSVSSPGSGGDSREEEEGLVEGEEEEGDTTTTDTDDFRSPPVSPLKLDRGGGRIPSPLELRPPPISGRSTKELLGGLEGLRSGAPTYTKELLDSPADSLGSLEEDDITSNADDDPTTQSNESSCVSAQDYWETGGESDFGAAHSPRSSPPPVNTGPPEVDHHEERRFSERFFPRSFPQPTRRTRRRTKKRHIVHSPQDSGSQSQSAEEEKSSSYLSSLTSDDEPTRYDPLPSDVTPCSIAGLRAAPMAPTSGLSALVDSSEPVTSDRGSWGMRDVEVADAHRSAYRYSRFDEEDTPTPVSWYGGEDDDVMVSPRSSQAFVDRGPPPGPDRHTSPPGHTAVKILMKNINTIKKKIKRYEEEFESAFGYRPSHSEKMKHKEIKKYMSELSKARKELKQMKDDVAGMMTVPSVFPLSLLRCQESTNPGAQPTTAPLSGTADTLRHVEDRLREKRSSVGRPVDLKNMNCTEMQEEKTALQKALLYYESVHGRPTTREDRDLARPLYDRYRQVKRIVVRSSSRTKENMIELPPIIEHVAMDFTLASPQHRSSLQGDEGEKLLPAPPAAPTTPPVTIIPPTFTADAPTSPEEDIRGDGQRSLALGDLHALPLSELRERKKEAREEKKKLRRGLREYEERFERDTGRKVQKEDRGPMEQTYLDYKHAKAKLRLLEALISKHDPVKV